MNKANIRLNKVTQRMNKPSFKAFTSEETQLLKASLLYDDMTRQIDGIWMHAKYDAGKLMIPL